MNVWLIHTQGFRTVYICKVWSQWLSFIFHFLRKIILKIRFSDSYSYAEISNIFCKINYDGQNFQAFNVNLHWWLKFPSFQLNQRKRSRVYYTMKKLFWKVLKMSQKKTFAWASFQIKLQAYSLRRFLKKASVHVFSSRFCQIF